MSLIYAIIIDINYFKLTKPAELSNEADPSRMRSVINDLAALLHSYIHPEDLGKISTIHAP